jgi:hypothetical protein
MAKHPESINCPACGSPDFIKVHSDLTAAFDVRLVSLRRCAECDAKYFPPTARWISVCALLLGGGVAAGGLYFGWIFPAYFAAEEFAARIGMRIFFYLLAAVGCGFALKGFLKIVSPQKLDPLPLTEDSQIYYEDDPANASRMVGIEPPP